MNGTLTIAARELRERGRVFLMAAALAVIPFLAALFPGASEGRGNMIALTGAVLGVALGIATAIALGTSTIGRELSEKRLSYYFTAPVSAAAIWIGKSAAALITSMACLAIIALPAFVAGGASWNGGFVDAPAILIAGALAIVVLFFVSHSVSTIVRSRSPLIALDVTLAAAAAVALYFIVRTTAAASSSNRAATLLALVLIALLIALAVAPVWQLANGRTDVRRNHLALSRALWTAVLAVVVLAGGYALWLRAFDAADLSWIGQVQQPPAGNWVMAGGPMPHRSDFAFFAVNSVTGQSFRMPFPKYYGGRFSRDGRIVAGMERSGRKMLGDTQQGGQLIVRNLDRGETVDTGIEVERNDFVLSDDGSRAAVIIEDRVAVHDLRTGKILGAATGLQRLEAHSYYFATPDVVRIIEDARNGLRVFELNAATRSFVKTGQAAASRGGISATADGTRMLIRPGTIADGRTAATLSVLPEWNAEKSWARMLYDGTVVRTGRVGGASRLQIFDRDGRLRHDLVLAVKEPGVAGGTIGGKLLVFGIDARDPAGMYLIDVATGHSERTRAEFSGPFFASTADPRQMAYPADVSLAGLDRVGKLVVWKVNGHDQPRRVFASR